MPRLEEHHDHDHLHEDDHEHHESRIRPYIYMEKMQKMERRPDGRMARGKAYGYKLYCMIISRDSLWEVTNKPKPNYSISKDFVIVKVSLKKRGEGPSFFHLKRIDIDADLAKGRPVKVQIIPKGGPINHDGTGTVHPPDSDDDEEPTT